MNEQWKLFTGMLANGGLAFVAGGLGLWWTRKPSDGPEIFWSMVFFGFALMFLAVPLLGKMKSEE